MTPALPLHIAYPPLLGYHPVLAAMLMAVIIVGAVAELWLSKP